MDREELKERVNVYFDRHSQAKIDSTPEEHKRAEEIIKNIQQEKTGTKEEYPFRLKQHPNQRIYSGDKII